MSGERLVRTSKFLSLVLRHDPGKAGVRLDEAGWCDVEELLEGCRRAGHPISRELLDEVVATNDKKRFAFSPDGKRIRASQGHSVEVELGYRPAEPPPVLFHGTADRHLESIRRQGLVRGQRHHVHLSQDRETALRVGQRHGRPVVLTVDSAGMVGRGHTFFLSENGVWLTECVPAEFLTFE